MLLKSLLGETAAVTVEFRKHKIHVVYRPWAYTQGMLDDMSDKGVSHLLVAILESWDIQSEEGKNLPLDPAVMDEQVPIPIMQAISSAIIEDMLPNRKTRS